MTGYFASQGKMFYMIHFKPTTLRTTQSKSNDYKIFITMQIRSNVVLELLSIDFQLETKAHDLNAVKIV